MVMSTLRENTKWIMLVLTVAFAGWLVFDWVQSRQAGAAGGSNPVVGVVAGHEIRYTEWNRYLSQQLDQARQNSGGPLTDEQRWRLEEEAWDQYVNELLIQQELERLGIQVTDQEIRQAFRVNPPPQLRSHPAFQTGGSFDHQKYREYFRGPGVNQQLLLQIESYYREVLPRSKLLSLVSQEVYLSDEELWRAWRERNETATARFVSLPPSELVPDTAVRVSEDEIRDYYDDHREEFSRPATAVANVVSLAGGPSPRDTAAARARIDSLHRVISAGEADFAEIARRFSSDTATAEDGGLVGTLSREEISPPLREVVFSAPVGRVSDPVETPAGFQLVKVDSRRGDSATVRHIVLPVEMSLATEDSLFGTMDRLEGIALREGLAAAADSLGLRMREEVVLSEGSRFVPGAGQLGVAVDWALNPNTEIGQLSRFFENPSGFHLVELVERRPPGTFPLAEVRDQIRQRLVRRKREERALEVLDAFADSVRSGGDFQQLAEARGWEVRSAGPFTRRDFVNGLGQNTEAVGAAFGLAAGSVSGAVEAGDRVAVIQVTDRGMPDAERFLQVRDQLRNQLTSQRRQNWLDRWMNELRERAEVQDLRNQLDARQDAAGT